MANLPTGDISDGLLEFFKEAPIVEAAMLTQNVFDIKKQIQHEKEVIQAAQAKLMQLEAKSRKDESVLQAQLYNLWKSHGHAYAQAEKFRREARGGVKEIVPDLESTKFGSSLATPGLAEFKLIIRWVMDSTRDQLKGKDKQDVTFFDWDKWWERQVNRADIEKVKEDFCPTHAKYIPIERSHIESVNRNRAR